MREHDLSSVAELAEQINTARSVLYDFIRPRRTPGTESLPNLQTVIRLAEALNTPTHELIYLIAPEAPGAPEPLADARTTQTPSRQARDRLRALAVNLPDTDTFLRERRAESGE